MRCDFCQELAGDPDNSFVQIYQNRPLTRILFRSARFAIIPSLGQIVEGHLLILPIKHLKALGDLDGPCLDELTEILEHVARILHAQYGSYVLFEHGTRSEEAGGCGIYHAHLHATPLTGIADPVDSLKESFPCTELKDLEEIAKQSAGLPSYLFYQDAHARLYLFDTGPLPSQYMRKLLADALQHTNWNWRTVGREEQLLATIERVSGEFDSLRKHG